jgi:ribonuclease-3
MKVEPSRLNEKDQFGPLQDELGYTFKDSFLLLRCLTHVSYGGHKSGGHNEVLEFLGDAVLDLVISDLLFQRFPDKNEGDLSRMRAGLVNSAALAKKASSLKLGNLLRLGKGEERSGGRSKPSILAGAFEALVGGIYRDGGYPAAVEVIERHFAAEIGAKELGQQDYKTRLQEISQLLFRAPPTYQLTAQTGPDHDKRFITEISVGGKTLGHGEGKSKKQSEQAAAEHAIAKLQRTKESGTAE